eukprot:CAMPEP_0178991706 /NCGR_PEP_ID=MMETSP0795-20121207/5686_1 /TAXON_ID=88552 /ORGANISM="Amoebophrya sp., Strain Ameob2" /LENGTH=161 /DNA_ID=CAMNT_0020683463 /DNA_START=367 /DNA_END=852 /DNA_ORIENTATION=+
MKSRRGLQLVSCAVGDQHVCVSVLRRRNRSSVEEPVSAGEGELVLHAEDRQPVAHGLLDLRLEVRVGLQQSLVLLVQHFGLLRQVLYRLPGIDAHPEDAGLAGHQLQHLINVVPHVLARIHAVGGLEAVVVLLFDLLVFQIRLHLVLYCLQLCCQKWLVVD